MLRDNQDERENIQWEKRYTARRELKSEAESIFKSPLKEGMHGRRLSHMEIFVIGIR